VEQIVTERLPQDAKFRFQTFRQSGVIRPTVDGNAFRHFKLPPIAVCSNQHAAINGTQTHD